MSYKRRLMILGTTALVATTLLHIAPQFPKKEKTLYPHHSRLEQNITEEPPITPIDQKKYDQTIRNNDVDFKINLYQKGLSQDVQIIDFNEFAKQQGIYELQNLSIPELSKLISSFNEIPNKRISVTELSDITAAIRINFPVYGDQDKPKFWSLISLMDFLKRQKKTEDTEIYARDMIKILSYNYCSNGATLEESVNVDYDHATLMFNFFHYYLNPKDHESVKPYIEAFRIGICYSDKEMPAEMKNKINILLESMNSSPCSF